MISFITSPASATSSIALQMVLKFHLRESSMVKLFIKTIRNTLHLTPYELGILNTEI